MNTSLSSALVRPLTSDEVTTVCGGMDQEEKMLQESRKI